MKDNNDQKNYNNQAENTIEISKDIKQPEDKLIHSIKESEDTIVDNERFDLKQENKD